MSTVYFSPLGDQMGTGLVLVGSSSLARTMALAVEEEGEILVGISCRVTGG